MKFPFPAIAAAFRERRMVHQPVPDVSKDDVERIVRRDFPAQFANVIEILNRYGVETREQASSRVRLAALKLADGNLDSLAKHIDTAKRDYRDVLVAAEYPGYAKVGFRMRELSKKERQRIVDADWNQYEDWLRRT